MASSISSSHLHRDRRHPRRRLAYVAAVAIMGLAAETVLLHLTQLSHPPGSYADVSRAPPSADVSAAARRSSAAGPSSPPSLAAVHRCRLVISVYGHMGAAIAVLSLSPRVSSNLPSRDVAPSAAPPVFRSELHRCTMLRFSPLEPLSQEPGACV